MVEQEYKAKKIDFSNFTFMNAPLEDISDNAYRTICHKYGADITFTEMVRVEALAKNNASTWSRLDFCDDTPTIIQLLVAKEDRLKKFLGMFKPSPGFLGFNLNLGCPSPHVVKIGQGCAMVKRIAKTKKLVEIIKSFGYPVSIKMRLGMNKYEKENKVYLSLIKYVDADFFIVHGRHGGQSYAEAPDYSVFEEIVATGKVIIANGDIDSAEKIDYFKKIGVKGVMIGRSAVIDPTLFGKLKNQEVPDVETIKNEYLAISDQNNSPFRYRKRFLTYFNNLKLKEQLNTDEK
jgi:tRNA-dihydrouridine synthase B